jgi:tRNA (mo5U34)-methyltransferase
VGQPFAPESQLKPELREEIDAGPTWSYPWHLAEGVTTKAHRPWLAELTDTSSQMIEPYARQALQAHSGEGTALDIACNEGLISQRLLDWGASRALGIDSRELNIRRARLIRDQLGIPAARLAFEQRDLFHLDPAADGQFDVVAMLGIVYHLENPMGAIRLARALTRAICLIESQVIDSGDPIEWTTPDGESRSVTTTFALYREPDDATQGSPLAAMPGIVSQIPNRAALVEMASAAGFRSVEVVNPPADAHPEHLNGNRAVVVAHT